MNTCYAFPSVTRSTPLVLNVQVPRLESLPSQQAGGGLLHRQRLRAERRRLPDLAAAGRSARAGVWSAQPIAMATTMLQLVCVCVCVSVCVCEYVCVHACVSHPGGPRAWTAPAGAMPRMIARRVLRCRSARCLLGPRGAGRRAVPALRSDLLVRPADGGAVIALEAAPIAT